MEVFERAAAAGGQLLQVERLAPAVDGDDTAALLLTFDVGRILVSLDSATARLVATHVSAAGDGVPRGAVNANEEEPWWRLLGSALVRVAVTEDATCLRLDFRIAGAASRTLALVSDGVRLRASIESDR